MTRFQFSPLAVLMLVLPLCWSTACIAQSSPQPPQLFFTDLDSAPNSGGENVSGFAGAYVTLYGNFLGASQGSSTVTWNGQNCLRVVGPAGSYNGWGSSHFWYQRIVVQLGSGCTPGSGNFVVTVNGTASNGIPFTVRSNGNIYFVATNGNDSASGGFASPFATIHHCKTAMNAGDTCYVMNGVTATTIDNYNAALAFTKGGTAGNPIALVGYPGAVATIGSASISYSFRVPNINVSANYVTLAGLFFSGSDQSDATNSTNWRVVGNNFQCPNANGQTGCFTSHEISTLAFLGNEVTNVGVVAASKLQHAVYLSSDTNHVALAWNYIHDNRSCRAIQFHSSPLGGGGATDTTGHNQFDLSVHDNLIHDDPCDGINFATVDPSQGKVEAYNNVIYHVGIGPAPHDGDGDYSCIYLPYITNTGPVGVGTVEIYNNTLYDCGSHAASFGNNGAFVIGGGDAGLLVRIRNNIMYQLGSEPFGTGGGWNSTYVSGSNNLAFSTGTPSLPSFLTGTAVSDPLFVNASGHDFHLQANSPAIDSGVAISGSNTYKSYQPWNGRPLDRDGVQRPQGPGYDIGSYERYAGSSQPAPALQSIAVAPNPATVNVGATLAFTATGHYSDGSTQNVTSSATWNSSNSSLASVSGGVARGVAAGSGVTITASVSGVSGTASLTVNQAPAPTLQTISIAPATASVTVGATVSFAATGHYSDGSTQNLTSSATWTSSNASVATVSKGVATGVAAGNGVTITASLSGISSTAALTVSATPTAPKLQSISVAPTPATVAVGSTVGLTATAHYSDGSTKNMTSTATWSSSNTGVATVAATGVATGVTSGGPVTITASLSGMSGTASVTVTPTPSTVVVNFDTPVPAGSPYGPLNGVYGGINFGTSQWSWEHAFLSDTTNNIYFASATGNSRSFTFASGSHVLISMKVATSVPGTLTLTDNTGQTRTQSISTGSMQLVTTGWKNASTTITVTFTGSWNIEFDDITYN